MIASLVLAAAVMAAAQGAGPAAADSHNPPVTVSGVDVRPTPVVATPVILEKRLKSQADAIICKRKQVAGSLMPGPRICATNAEWADLSYQDQSSLRKQQQKSTM